MKNIDVLKLEVQTDPPAGTLPNLIANPSGEQGAWGWVTPVAGTTIASTTVPRNPCLQYNPAATGANFFYSDPYAVTVGQSIGASWVVQSCNVGAGSGWYRASVEFLNASFVLLSATTPTPYLQKDTTGGRAYLPTATVPASTVYARLRFDMYSSNAGAIVGTTNAFMTVHNAAMVTAATAGALSVLTRTNLVTNPSFGVDAASWTAYPSAFYARSTTFADVGTASLKVTNSTPNTYDGAKYGTSSGGIPITFSTNYSFSVRVRADNTAATAVLKALWYGSTGPGVQVLIRDDNVGFATTTSAGWTTISGTLMSPASGGSSPLLVLGVQFNAPVSTGLVQYIDSVMVEKTGTVGTYFDGDTPDVGTDAVYAWTGAAHNSTSTLTEYAPYSDGVWTNILGPTHEIKVSREDLNVGILTATVLDNTLDPATVNLIRPGRRVRLRALDAGTAGYTSMFEGRVTEADVTYDLQRTDNKQARISLVAADNIRQIANTSRSEGVETISELRYLMEGAGVPWLVNGNSNQAATATVVASNGNASLLDQISITRDTKLGYAWVNRSGVLVANDAASMSATEKATLNESVYSDLDVSFNSNTCINDVRVKWLRYTPATGDTTEIIYGPYRDAASIKEWGSHQAEFTAQGAAESAAAIQSYANQILAANGTPVVRINSVQIPIRVAADVSMSKALLDLYDLVRLQNTSKALNHVSRITGIEHEITSDRWLMHVNFSVNGAVASPQLTPPPGTGSAASAPVIGVAQGGTGLATVAAGNFLSGNGTSPMSVRTTAQVRTDIGAAPSVHQHAGTDITTGTIADARLPTTMANKTLSNPTFTETEPWHVVGAAGEPAFASGTADATYPPSFRIDSNNVVHIRGVVTSGVATTLTTVFTLPAGYRPSAQTPAYSFICYMNPLGSVGRVVITSAGLVQIQRIVGTSSTGYQIDCSFTTR